MRTKLLETVVQMQHSNQKMPPTERRLERGRMTLARFYERTKKQHEMPRVPQVANSQHKQQPLSEMSHTHRDFFDFVPPPSYERTEASTDKKCYH
jgi:hypothetical protein